MNFIGNKLLEVLVVDLERDNYFIGGIRIILIGLVGGQSVGASLHELFPAAHAIPGALYRILLIPLLLCFGEVLGIFRWLFLMDPYRQLCFILNS